MLLTLTRGSHSGRSDYLPEHTLRTSWHCVHRLRLSLRRKALGEVRKAACLVLG